MPALRKILVRAYPSAFASKIRSLRGHHEYGSHDQSHGSGGARKTAIESGTKHSQKSDLAQNISYTQTFDVRSQQNLDNDESALVELRDIGRTPSGTRSDDVSEVSL